MVNQKYESLVETICWHFSPIFKLKSTLSFDFDLTETKILSYTLLMVEYDNNQQSKIVGIARLTKAKEMRGNGGSCSPTLFNVASKFLFGLTWWSKWFSFRSPVFCFSHNHEDVENGWTWDILSTFSTSMIILKGSFILIHCPAKFMVQICQKLSWKNGWNPYIETGKMIDPETCITLWTPGVWCYAFVQIKDCEHLGILGQNKKVML